MEIGKRPHLHLSPSACSALPKDLYCPAIFMRHTFLISFSFLLLLLPIFSVRAEDGVAIEQPVYVIDMQKAVAQSVMGKAAKSTVEAEIKKREAGLQAANAEIVKLKGDLGKQAALLSPEALAVKRDALDKKQKDLERKLQDMREELSKINNRELGKIVREIDVVVKDLAKKNNYKMIIERDPRLVTYINPDYDITEQVIEALDSRKMGM